MKAATLIVALVAALAVPTLLFIGNVGASKVQSELSVVSGELKFNAGKRGDSPSIEVSTSTRKLKFVCPRSVRTFPCNEPQEAFRLVAGGAGTIRYYKYEVAPADAGQGIIQSVQLGNRLYSFQ
ncbi:hypothetical protein [Aquabacterium sp. CECT 9606]|uniref:hypothetical protein n=1 Tax=Aquabacterium sp. CECT 9606 TaxID=2845822 RepID=UPI001E3E7C96|nr:hypothetical protein [Aquabacterium sp. CECT 9606]